MSPRAKKPPAARPKGRTVHVRTHCRNTGKGRARVPKWLKNLKSDMPF